MEEKRGRVTAWTAFKRVLMIQFTQPPYPEVKRKGRHL